MKRCYLKSLLPLLHFVMVFSSLQAQKSVLINFGRSSCYDNLPPSFSMIKNPLTLTPSLMATCDLTAQLPDFYSVFISYNPKNNKVYIADNRTGLKTDIWILDVGLPGSVECPPVIPATPTYSYNYISNNFEFDNNGDLWSFSNYNPTTGQCNIDKFDVTTGAIINTRILQFPAGNYPTNINNGDLCILPNGRMFATLGSFPSQLYEITNYNNNNIASASYINTLPLNCFGIAYLSGQLEITGFDNFGCYYYTYNLATNELRGITNFQNSQLPVDNTSFTPAIGVTKHIVSTSFVNSTTADITYEIYVKNMGNVMLNNVNVTDDLAEAFGASNISNVTTSFTPGSNNAGLVLNPAYNGVTEINLLNANQQLINQNSTNNDYYCKIQVSCRVSNLNPGTVYYNSAIGTATINNAIDPISLADSSNNGLESVIDPNNDGDPTGIGENEPTPFSIAALPVHFVNANAFLHDHDAATIRWSVATPVTNAKGFEIEFSVDGMHWTDLGFVPVTNERQSEYVFTQANVPQGNLYYRIKQTDNNSTSIYSKVMFIQRKPLTAQYTIYPNPANGYIMINTSFNINGNTIVGLYDIEGRIILSKILKQNNLKINTEGIPVGTYLLKITDNNQTRTEKVLIRR